MQRYQDNREKLMDNNRKSYLKLGEKLDSLSRVTSRITVFVNYLDGKKIKTQNFEERLEVKN